MDCHAKEEKDNANHTAAAATELRAEDVEAPAIAVLTKLFWDLVTAFMKGYPLAVHEFLRVNKTTRLLCNKSIGHLEREGRLVHLAIAANNPTMLQRLYALSKHPHNQKDTKLCFKRAMRCAVLYNHAEMLECLGRLKGLNPEWQWEPHLMGFAVIRHEPDLRVVGWLHAHLPSAGVSEEVVDAAATNGHVHVLRYLYENTPKRCRRAAVEVAAGKGYLDVVQLVVENQVKEKSFRAINVAAANGKLDVVRFLVESKIRLEAPRVIDCAAKGGHLDVVRFLHELRPRKWCTARAMDGAAVNGHLEVVRFLYENRREGCSSDALSEAARNGHAEVVKFLSEKYASMLRCSTDAMDDAAANGHLEVLKFLHESSIGECSTRAMDGAATNGHLETVEFLHSHRTEGCTTSAMNGAAANGHLEVVKFLHLNRTEGCTPEAMHLAASTYRYGRSHLGVVQFLFEHRRSEEIGDVQTALCKAVLQGDLRIVKFLHQHLPPGESAYPAVEVACTRRNSDAVEYLCENQENEQVRILRQAVLNGSDGVVWAVLQYPRQHTHSREELEDAKALAMERDLPRIVGWIDLAIDGRR